MSLLGKSKLYFNKSRNKEYKLAMVGDSSVGKSSIASRIGRDTFSEFVNSTIGGAFSSFDTTRDKIKYKFQLWDTAGQERYNALVPMYLNNTNIVLLVFDITNKTSFERIQDYWHYFVTETVPGVDIILIGNKSDMINKRKVSIKEATEFSIIYNMTYIECSAKNSHNIDNLIDRLVDIVTDINFNNPLDDEIVDLTDVLEIPSSCIENRCN